VRWRKPCAINAFLTIPTAEAVETGNIPSHERLYTGGPKPKKTDYSYRYGINLVGEYNYNNRARFDGMNRRNQFVGKNQERGRGRGKVEGLLPDRTNLTQETIG